MNGENTSDKEDDDNVIDVSATGGLLQKFRLNGVEFGHHGAVNDATFSPSELRIATAGGDKLIKLWDPRDGTFVRSLRAHTNEVTSVQYTQNELYLISSGADMVIMVWDLTVNSVLTKLYGHADIIYSMSNSPDCSFIVSAGHDYVLKTWFLTPRVPDHIDSLKFLTITDRTVLLSWTAPTSFGEEITAYYIQYRNGIRGPWQPDPPINIPPTFRNKLIKNLVPATNYQFQIRAENMMGKAEWSPASKVIQTEFGMPDILERPQVSDVTRTSVFLYWFTPNPYIFGSSARKFIIERVGEGLEFSDFPTVTVELKEAVESGTLLMEKFKRRCAFPDKINPGDEQKGMDLPVDIMRLAVDRSDDENYLFVSYEVKELDPGYMFRFRITGCNRIGNGPPSPLSYSVSTNASEPVKPSHPFIAKTTLTTIKFQWHAPDDCGSAIIGYRIHVKHINKTIDLPRTQTTYKIYNLKPGRSYYMRVLAKNGVGWGPFSDFNPESNSKSKTEKPDRPENPTPVAATYCSITLKMQLPYSNGSDINYLITQRYINSSNTIFFKSTTINCYVIY